MISVLNRLQRLSGSKLLLLSCLLLCFSCNSSKKTVTKKRTTKRTSTKRTSDKTNTTTKVIKKDDVDWAKDDKNKTDEKETDQEEQILDSEIKDVYNVSVFIPFDVNSSASISLVSLTSLSTIMQVYN